VVGKTRGPTSGSGPHVGPLAAPIPRRRAAFIIVMDKTPRSLLVLRYGVGGAMVVAGIVLLVMNLGGFGVDGFALGVGGGLSVVLLNFFYRLGVSGDREREQEEAARAFFDRHGRWPDEVEDARPLAERVREFVTIDDEHAAAHH
jgi:hypothetical protein